jgi:hypothetical protein
MTDNAKHIEGLKSVISDIFKLAFNTRISCRTHSITGLLKLYGVATQYSSILLDVLGNHGLIFKEGEKAGMHYTIIADVIPDAGPLAEECLLRYRKYGADHRNVKRVDDLEAPVDPNTPVVKRAYKTRAGKEGSQNGTAKVVQRENPIIGDTMFMMDENKILEVRVTGTLENNKKEIVCNVEQNRLESNYVWRKNGVQLSSLYTSVETLIKVLAITMIKNSKSNL